MKHWVFDLDGTLVDSFAHYFAALDEIFSRHGARFTPDQRLPAITASLPLFFKEHLGAPAVPTALNLLQELSNDDALKIQPFVGVRELLFDLKDRGAKIAVWTNRDFVSADLILKQTGLDRYLEVFLSGTCTALRKPDPEGLVRILDRFQCAPADLTMVGDHDHDVLAAKAVGARAVRASWHSYWPVEACPHADFQFHEMAAFSRWAASKPA